MPIKQIKTTPDPILRKKTEKVGEITQEIRTLIKDLLDTVKHAEEPEGAGLASPQIGVSKRVCVVRDFLPDPSDPTNPQKHLIQDIVLVNPKIISKSKETDIDWEGCLSVPDTYGKVQRATKIKLKALDQDGNPIKIKTEGFLARTIQHEVDHLDGVLFTDKVVGNVITQEELDALEEVRQL